MCMRMCMCMLRKKMLLLESQSFDERWWDKYKYREFCLVLFIKVYVLAGVKTWPVELKNRTMIELKISE